MFTTITAVRNKTFKNLQLNSGAVLVNFDYSKITDLTALKSAIATALERYDTTVGATLAVYAICDGPTPLEFAADHRGVEQTESALSESGAIKLTGTLIEIVPGNIVRVLATGEASDNEGKTVTTVKTRTALKEADYIKSVTWVGDTSQGAMMITLFNALNTSGATLTINDKGEGTLPFEFVAHQSDVEQTEYAPYEIVYLNPAQSV